MSMRKCVVTVLILALCTVSLFAAGQSEPAASAAKTYEIKVGIDKTPSHAFYMGLEKMNESLVKSTNGNVKIKIYGESVLGSEREMSESLIIGNLDMTVNGMLGVYEPLFNVLDAPYLFTSREQIRAFHDSDAFKEMCANLESNHNIKVLTYFEGGFRQVSNNIKPIYSVADLKGIKMRVPEIEAMKLTFAALNTVVTPMSSKELYGALQQGVVDGQENPYANIFSMSLYEVQKYVSATNHQYNSGYVYMSKKLYDSMPAEYQKALMAAARDASMWQVQYSADNDEAFKQKLIDKGMMFNEIKDVKEFQAATTGVYEVFYKNYGDKAKSIVAQINALGK